MILGISLVVQELNKGPRLLFRYPEESSSYYHRTFQAAVEGGGLSHSLANSVRKLPTSNPPAITSTYVASNGTSPSFDEGSSSSEPSSIREKTSNSCDSSLKTSIQRSTAAIRLNQIYEQYFGLSDENFAKLFRAKNALLGKVLDFSIGDLHFISLPCTCPLVAPAVPPGHDAADAHNVKEKSYAEAVAGNQPPSIVNPEGSGEGDLISSFNIVIAVISRKAMFEIQKDFLYNCQNKSCALAGEDPIAAAMGLRTKLTGVCNASIKRVLSAATQSLCFQEKKCRYLTKEISRILQVIDSHRNDPLKVANSDHVVKITEVNYFDARSDNIEADDTNENQTPMTIAVVEFGRSRRSSSNTSHANSALGSTSMVNNSATVVGQTWNNENTESPSDGIGGDCDRRRASQASSSSVLDISNPKLIQSNPTRFLCHNILMESNLANELKALFHGIAGFHGVNIRFNNSKPLHMQLVCKDVKSCEDSQGLISAKARGISTVVPTVFRPPALLPPTITKIDVAPISNVGGEMEDKGTSDGPASRPTKLWKGSSPWYETLLLLGDPESVISVLGILDGVNNVFAVGNSTTPLLQTPVSGGTRPNTPTATAANLRLQALIENADPTQSFIDLSFQLDEPVEELINMANYLQTWGLAEVIPIIYKESCYQVHPSAPLSATSRVAKAFEALINSFDISGNDNHTQAPPQTAHTRKRSSSYTAGSSVHGTTASATTVGNFQLNNGKKQNDTLFQTMDDMIQDHFISDRHGIHQPQYHAPNVPLPTILEQSTISSRGSSINTLPLPSRIDVSTPALMPATEIVMDCHTDVSPDFSLPKILTLFDGSRTIGDIVVMLPSSLREYALDIVIFLLRWHMLVQVNYFFVNLLAMPSTSQELLDPDHPINQVVSTPAGQGSQRRQRRDSYDETKSGNLGLYLSDSERSLEIESYLAEAKRKQNLSRSNLTNTIQASDEAVTFMKNVHTIHLTQEERHSLEKIAPFIENNYISSKTVSEILWIAKINDRDLNWLLKKLPYLKKIKKIQ